MDWQQIVTLLIVGISAVLLILGQVRRRQRARSRLCGHDCGCSAGSDAILKKAVKLR